MLTSKSLIFFDSTGIVLRMHSCLDLAQHKHYLVVMHGSELTLSGQQPKIAFMDLSPCKQYLLVGIKAQHKPNAGTFLIIIDVRRREIVLKEHYLMNLNCGMWMPSCGPHGMGVCVGSTTGNILICSEDKR